MKEGTTRILKVLAIALVVALVRPGLASAQDDDHKIKPLPPKKSGSAATLRSSAAAGLASSWQLLTTQPPLLDFFDCGPGSPVLLTDGTVLVADNGCQDWWKLTPDQFGSYVNGTWSQIASLPAGYSPLYHSTAVLPDGRVIIEGGEYNFLTPEWTAQGAIYDPRADTWTPVAPPPFFTGFGPFPQTIGDAQATVLFDGTYMQSNCCKIEAALLDTNTLTWTPTGSGKFDDYDEEGWTLLPNKQVLTVDAYVGKYDPAGMAFELYNPSSGEWSSPGGGTKVQLWDSAADCGGRRFASFEVGPAVLMNDGSVFATGANACGAAHTAVYKGSWKAGPDFPDHLGIADGPAALEPNGKVLMMASPLVFRTPSTFFEWDGSSLSVAPPAPNASNDSSFYGNMLVLPTGQILFTDFFFVSVYNPSGTYNPAWQPVIQKAPSTVTPGGSYVISGHLFNGMSQGAAYGDDAQSATNYPIVRITNNATGHVFYSRTHDHSSMAVAFNGLVSTTFDVPANQETGPSKLEVVANGIPSAPLSINVQ
ncbi:MAG TPA: kelch repeat-containing protein [Thermoanaerobaculia bacterium]